MKIVLYVSLSIPLIACGMDTPDSIRSHSSDDNTLAGITQSERQTISRAQSFIRGKEFQAIGDEFMVYPDYLADEEQQEYYIEQRDIAMAHLGSLKSTADIDYFRLYIIESNLRLLNQINFEKKLLDQIPSGDIIGACAYLLDEFESNFTATAQDFGPDEQIEFLHTKNRKKFRELLVNGAPKETINEAGRAAFGTINLHDYFAGALAITAAMQYAHGPNPMGRIDATIFWSRVKHSDEMKEKFTTKFQETAEKFKAMK